MKKEKPKQKSDRLDGCGRLRQELQFKTNLDYPPQSLPTACVLQQAQGVYRAAVTWPGLTQGLHDHPELKLQCDTWSTLCSSMGVGGTWRQERLQLLCVLRTEHADICTFPNRNHQGNNKGAAKTPLSQQAPHHFQDKPFDSGF